MMRTELVLLALCALCALLALLAVVSAAEPAAAAAAAAAARGVRGEGEPEGAPRGEASRKPELVPGLYLVRMEAGAGVEGLRKAKAHVQSVHASREEVHMRRTAQVTAMEITRVMTAFELKDASQEMVDYVKAMEGVRHVTQQRILRTTVTSSSWGQDRIDQASLPLDNDYTTLYDGSGVDIYIFDTGLDTNHVDFTETQRSVENVYNAYASTSTDTDGHGHGTHVAGTAGSDSYGVATGANLYGVKVLDDLGAGTDGTIAAAIDWAVNRVSKNSRRAVFSMSLGGGCTTRMCPGDVINEALNAAVAEHIPVAVAAGNDYDDACYHSPASATCAITVASTESDDDASLFTNYGSCVDIAAPGTSIISTCSLSQCSNEASIAMMSGTSMACPHVSGVLAQYFEANPTGTADEAKEALLCSAAENEVNYGTVTGDARNYMLQIMPATPKVCDLGAGCPSSCSDQGTCDTAATPYCRCDPEHEGTVCSQAFTPTPAPTPAPPFCANENPLVMMQDEGADGYNSAYVYFYDNGILQDSMTMFSGSLAFDWFCPLSVGQCYAVSSTAGTYPSEVWFRACGLVGGANLANWFLCFKGSGKCYWQCNEQEFTIDMSATWYGQGFRLFDSTLASKYNNVLLAPDALDGETRKICLPKGTYGLSLNADANGGLEVEVGNVVFDEDHPDGIIKVTKNGLKVKYGVYSGASALRASAFSLAPAILSTLLLALAVPFL